MSRARPIHTENGTLWFDVKSGGQATEAQLELLATVEDIDLDDLLEEVLTQVAVLDRLRKALGQGKIPEDVQRRREEWRAERQNQPECRICHKEGDSTKHHFVNKWILKELDRYSEDYADRRKNCIPICVDCHRDLHWRESGPHSIAPYLDDDEKRFAEEALRAFAKEHLSVLLLIARGDLSTYETQLVNDWYRGAFTT